MPNTQQGQGFLRPVSSLARKLCKQWQDILRELDQHTQKSSRHTDISWCHLPIFCLIDDVTYFHVEGPVLTLQRAIGGFLWKPDEGMKS